MKKLEYSWNDFKAGYGFTNKDVRAWKNVFASVDIADNWANEGFTIEETLEWRDLGFSYEEAAKWKNYGFNSILASKYRDESLSLDGFLNTTAMWKDNLQDVYVDFEEFKSYSEVYNLHQRLGYDTPEDAWMDNPLVEGSVDPADYKKISSMIPEQYKLKSEIISSLDSLIFEYPQIDTDSVKVKVAELDDEQIEIIGDLVDAYLRFSIPDDFEITDASLRLDTDVKEELLEDINELTLEAEDEDDESSIAGLKALSEKIKNFTDTEVDYLFLALDRFLS